MTTSMGVPVILSAASTTSGGGADRSDPAGRLRLVDGDDRVIGTSTYIAAVGATQPFPS